jgi:ribosomal protein S27AE
MKPRCPACHTLLLTTHDKKGVERLVCARCDQVDPLKTVAAKWVESAGLTAPK